MATSSGVLKVAGTFTDLLSGHVGAREIESVDSLITKAFTTETDLSRQLVWVWNGQQGPYIGVYQTCGHSVRNRNKQHQYYSVSAKRDTAIVRMSRLLRCGLLMKITIAVASTVTPLGTAWRLYLPDCTSDLKTAESSLSGSNATATQYI